MTASITGKTTFPRNIVNGSKINETLSYTITISPINNITINVKNVLRPPKNFMYLVEKKEGFSGSTFIKHPFLYSLFYGRMKRLANNKIRLGVFASKFSKYVTSAGGFGPTNVGSCNSCRRTRQT